ncbi:uncharacterized protein LOC111630402 [Centruroides sculpturatus]|uniref:uncharacterized protein LOC111630402 n=1 Tax=Centruroides sculpturatus TaxID=218467 RepID=UPI000C6E1A48|nr:uncharacterized protein LOC111630402 [Centruroides sculpturatus]
MNHEKNTGICYLNPDTSSSSSINLMNIIKRLVIVVSLAFAGYHGYSFLKAFIENQDYKNSIKNIQNWFRRNHSKDGLTEEYAVIEIKKIYRDGFNQEVEKSFIRKPLNCSERKIITYEKTVTKYQYLESELNFVIKDQSTIRSCLARKMLQKRRIDFDEDEEEAKSQLSVGEIATGTDDNLLNYGKESVSDNSNDSRKDLESASNESFEAKVETRSISIEREDIMEDTCTQLVKVPITYVEGADEEIDAQEISENKENQAILKEQKIITREKSKEANNFEFEIKDGRKGDEYAVKFRTLGRYDTTIESIILEKENRTNEFLFRIHMQNKDESKMSENRGNNDEEYEIDNRRNREIYKILDPEAKINYESKQRSSHQQDLQLDFEFQQIEEMNPDDKQSVNENETLQREGGPIIKTNASLQGIENYSDLSQNEACALKIKISQVETNLKGFKINEDNKRK